MLFNVAQLMQEPVGSERSYPFSGEVPAPDEGTGPTTVSGNVRLVRTHRGILAYGVVDGTLTDPCARCLTPVTTEVHAEFEDEFLPSIDVATGAPLRQEDEPGVFSIDEHHHLDLTPAVQQAMELERPMQPLCREDCAGLCQRCGADLNQGACDCPTQETDDRWAKLGQLRLES